MPDYKDGFALDLEYFHALPSYKDRVALLLSRHGLPGDTIQVFLHAGLKHPGRAELIETEQGVRLAMVLNQDYWGSREAMDAITAHEFTHVYLFHNKLQQFRSTTAFKDPQEEYLTDVAAFVLGLGELMLKGCDIELRERRAEEAELIARARLGYLTREQMDFAQKEVLSRS